MSLALPPATNQVFLILGSMQKTLKALERKQIFPYLKEKELNNDEYYSEW